MNNLTNDSFLAGVLEAELRSIATDAKFLSIRNEDTRKDYVAHIIRLAYAKTEMFSNTSEENRQQWIARIQKKS